MHLADVSSGEVAGNSNARKAGRVVRLIRLVRLVRLYKIAMEKHKRDLQERAMMELIQKGQLDVSDLENERLLHEKRASKVRI